MVIVGLGTAAPPQRYAQRDCWEAVQLTTHFQALTLRSRAILKKILTGQNGIVTRHLALDKLEDVFDIRPDVLQARFVNNAPLLATQAAERALENADTEASQIDGVIISTCTGYLCPGLTSYVGERLGLRPNVLALDLVGQGCGAALPNLRTAHALLQGSCEHVLSICVEVCSAALYVDDDPGVLVSACLFGDGAAAAVSSVQPKKNERKVQWIGSVSH